MKITESYLRGIIREELIRSQLNESDEEDVFTFEDATEIAGIASTLIPPPYNVALSVPSTVYSIGSSIYGAAKTKDFKSVVALMSQTFLSIVSKKHRQVVQILKTLIRHKDDIKKLIKAIADKNKNSTMKEEIKDQANKIVSDAIIGTINLANISDEHKADLMTFTKQGWGSIPGSEKIGDYSDY